MGDSADGIVEDVYVAVEVINLCVSGSSSVVIVVAE
jgi:hypothetical protein